MAVTKLMGSTARYASTRPLCCVRQVFVYNFPKVVAHQHGAAGIRTHPN